MSENKEPVNFVTEMHRSIDGKTYYGIRPEDKQLPESDSETIPSSVTGEGQVFPSGRSLSFQKNATGFHRSGDGCLRAEPSQSTRHKLHNHRPMEAEISLPTLPKQNRTSSFPSSTEQHPTDSHSTGRTGSVAASTEQQAELEEQDSHDWMETSVSPFIKRLSDADLAAINAGVIPTSLMKLMGRVAYNEIERRRDA